MQTPSTLRLPAPGHALPAHGPVIVGFRAHGEPESPNKIIPSTQRRQSLLSEMLRDAEAAAAEAEALLGGGEALAFGDDFDDDEDDDLAGLGEDELSLLEGLSAAWSPSSSLHSGMTCATAAAASHVSTCSSSRPIAIPAATYFKDQVQRMQLEKLTKKRQFHSQQLEQERLLGKTGAKAAAQQVPRPPLKHHRQFNGHGQQK